MTSGMRPIAIEIAIHQLKVCCCARLHSIGVTSGYTEYTAAEVPHCFPDSKTKIPPSLSTDTALPSAHQGHGQMKLPFLLT